MLYLAYGSNLHPDRLRERVPSANLLGSAALEQRTLRFHKRSVIDGSAKCNIYPGSGVVHGAVYDIAATEKPALDRAEGLGNGYRIDRFEVSGFGECFCYVATDSHIDDLLRPYYWYRQLVLAGCEYLAFPREYTAAIANHECIHDSNIDRHHSHMQLIDRLGNRGGCGGNTDAS